VEAAANTELLRLFGSQAQQAGFQYVSIHMRLGGMEQEKSLNSDKGGGNGPLLDLIQGVTCMQKKGEHLVACSASDSAWAWARPARLLRAFVLQPLRAH
jgi:hypothetical protein